MISAMLVVLMVVVVLIIVPWLMNRRTPQPSYKTLKKVGAIELRQYESLLLATTQVSDDRAAAIRTGFKRLARYLFGRHDNQTSAALR